MKKWRLQKEDNMEDESQSRIYFYFDESGDPNILGHHGINLLKEGKVSKTFSVGFHER